MQNIDSINFKNKRALVRVDFNVPFDKQFNITDDTRIKAALPTINKILKDGGSVVLMSHLGRPLKKLKEDGSIDTEKFSLKHVIGHLSDLLHKEIKFSADCVGQEAFAISNELKNGEILLLENTRFHKEEEKGDEAFAAQLAHHGDVYINDAFGSAHRAHASTTIVAKHFSKENRAAGYLLAAEVANAEKVLNSSEKPFTAILGGAKVSDKILIIENLLNIADNIIIGGGMAYTFVKALDCNVGNSLVEEDMLELALHILKKAKEKGVKIILPEDSIIADKFDNNANIRVVENVNIPDTWMGLDIGHESISAFEEVIKNSKTILWNGPMGVFEMEKFQNGTKSIAVAVAHATQKGAFSLVGGGDSVAAVNKFGLADQVSFVSTGGGALLEFFEGKTLPGVAALN